MVPTPLTYHLKKTQLLQALSPSLAGLGKEVVFSEPRVQKIPKELEAQMTDQMFSQALSRWYSLRTGSGACHFL